MGIKFASDEWIKELGDQLNQNEAYERSAKDWEGDFIFVIEPDESSAETMYVYLGLYHGKCTAAARVSSEDEREAEFVIRAPFSVWRQVVEGKLDPIQGLMTRKLKLQGNLMKIIRYPKAAQEIINSCSRVPTEFG
mgnify:CR=1 FL=1